MILKAVSDLAQDDRDAERRKEVRAQQPERPWSRNWRLGQDSAARSSLSRGKEKGPAGRGNSRRNRVELGPSRGLILETQVTLTAGAFPW